MRHVLGASAMLSAVPAPADAVLDAFRARGAAQRLGGGQGEAYLVDGIVVKRVDDAAETGWTCDLLTRVRPDGFRVSQPVSTSEGQWVYEGWAASRFILGLRSLAPRWGDVISAGMRFCDAAERARRDDDGVLAARSHRWAIADRVAWGEQALELHDVAGELFDDMTSEFGDAVYDPQFVHGDLSGNVFVDEHGTAVILDVSPYLRPRRWAAAIVVCDALLWHNSGPTLADSFAAQGDRGLLFRALAFRLVAEALADELSDDPAPLHDYRRVLTALQAHCRR